MTTPLLADVISTIPIEYDNAGGTAVDPPPAGTMSAVLDNTVMGTVALSADEKGVDFTPAQPPDLTQVGVITLNGLKEPVTLDISLTADAVIARGHFVTAGITTRPLGT